MNRVTEKGPGWEWVMSSKEVQKVEHAAGSAFRVTEVWDCSTTGQSLTDRELKEHPGCRKTYALTFLTNSEADAMKQCVRAIIFKWMEEQLMQYV